MGGKERKKKEEEKEGREQESKGDVEAQISQIV